MLKKLILATIFSSLLFGCISTGVDGLREIDTALVRDLSTISALIVTIEIDKRGVDPKQVLRHVQNFQTIVKNLAEGEPLNLLVLNEYINASVPVEYRTVTSLVLVLVKNRVNPILQLPIPENEKEHLIKDTAIAVFEGIEIAIQLHIANMQNSKEA